MFASFLHLFLSVLLRLNFLFCWVLRFVAVRSRRVSGFFLLDSPPLSRKSSVAMPSLTAASVVVARDRSASTDDDDECLESQPMLDPSSSLKARTSLKQPRTKASWDAGQCRAWKCCCRCFFRVCAVVGVLVVLLAGYLYCAYALPYEKSGGGDGGSSRESCCPNQDPGPFTPISTAAALSRHGGHTFPDDAAFVSLVFTHGLSVMSVCLSAHSLRQQYPGAPYFVLHEEFTPDTPTELKRAIAMASRRCNVTPMPVSLRLRDEIYGAVSAAGALKHPNWLRLALFNMTDLRVPIPKAATDSVTSTTGTTATTVRQFLFLDTDLVVLGSLEELIDCSATLCAAPHLTNVVPWTVLGKALAGLVWLASTFSVGVPSVLMSRFNGGVLSIRPNAEVYRVLLRALPAHQNGLDVLEQDFLASTFVADPLPELRKLEAKLGRDSFNLLSPAVNLCSATGGGTWWPFTLAGAGPPPPPPPPSLPALAGNDDDDDNRLYPNWPPNNGDLCDVRVYHFQGAECNGDSSRCKDFRNAWNECRFDEPRRLALQVFFDELAAVNPECGRLRNESACRSNPRCGWRTGVLLAEACFDAEWASSTRRRRGGGGGGGEGGGGEAGGRT